jgi:hypothetical protein
MKAGGALLLLGMVFTSLSYAGVLATAGSGRYYIATGAILFGAFTARARSDRSQHRKRE